MADPRLDPAPDPFANLESLRLDQSYAENAGVKKLLTHGAGTQAGPTRLLPNSSRTSPDPGRTH